MQLANKTALVTGGSDGLGFSIAKKLLEKGTKVAICGRSLERLKEAKLRLSSNKLSIFQCDVSDYQQVKKMAKQINSIDILINCAGVYDEGSLEKIASQRINQIIDINLKGTIYTCKAVLPDMRAKNEGFVLNISSTSGIKGKPNQSVYVASKYGVTGFTESLKIDLRDTNIKVAGFYPGGMRTKIFEKAGVKKDVSKWMDTDKVAEVIAFILETDDTVILDHVVLNKIVK